METENKTINETKKAEIVKPVEKVTKEIVKPVEKIKSEKKEVAKKTEEKKLSKTEAIVCGKDLKISTKHSIAICDYIRRKNIEKAIDMLSEILTYKKAVPMKGELPHRKGKIMSGRYPIKAVTEFIKLLKSLKANAIVNELELEKYVLYCKADVAARPYRRFGKGRFKRTNVIIKLILSVKKKARAKRK